MKSESVRLEGAAVAPEIDLSEDLSHIDVWAIGRGAARVFVRPEVVERLGEARKRFLEYVEKGGRCYGTTTGLGGLKDVPLDPREIPGLAKQILREHAAGAGPRIGREIVRGSMAVLARQLSLECSAASPELVETLVEMINRDLVPLVPSYGSLGASGDLAPMSYVGLALAGEWVVEKGGRVVGSLEALEEEGIRPHRLGLKEHLSVMNNTAMSSSIASHALAGSRILLKMLEHGAALAMEAMGTPWEHLDEDLVSRKRHPGCVAEARALRRVLRGSGNLGRSGVVQDIYSYRCAPQILGALADMIEIASEIVEREINSCTDNPLFLRGSCIHGCNFHGAEVGMAMDALSIALIHPLIQSERRLATVLDSKMSRGLPPFLSKDPGRSTGLMMLQYLSAALLNRAKTLAHPATIDSTPTSAGHEDHVSNSLNAGLKALEMVELGKMVASAEILAMARAVELRGWEDGLGEGSRRVYRISLEILESSTTPGEAVERLAKGLEKVAEKEILEAWAAAGSRS